MTTTTFSPRPWPNFVSDSQFAYAIEDAANIRGTLAQILGHLPKPHELPRIERRRAAYKFICGDTVQSRSVASARTYDPLKHSPFMRKMREGGIPVVLVDNGGPDPDDQWIREQTDLIPACGDLLLFSHDHGYAPYLQRLLRRDGRVAIVGFLELISVPLLKLAEYGAQFLDAEHDLGLFEIKLPNRPTFEELQAMRPQTLPRRP